MTPSISYEELKAAKLWIRMMLGENLHIHPTAYRDAVTAYREWKQERRA